MAYVSTVISVAASLGVLVGLISGIFFLVLTALRWISRVRASLYEEELIRQKRFLINNSYLADDDNPDFRETRRANNDFGNGLKGSNLQGKLDQGLQNNSENSAKWSEHGTDLRTPEKEEPNFDTVKVREMIEKMVETMTGGPLDGTTVGQLSTHSSYLDMFTKYHNLLCRELARLGFALHLSVIRKDSEHDSNNLKQYNLKRLIKRIVSEAMALPNIKKNLCRPKTLNEKENEDFKNKSYEDILATAILNKIIDNFQNKNYKINEKEGHPKPKLRNKKMKRKDNDIKSDDDWSDTSRSDQLSLTIEEYIEEVTTTLEISDDERSDFSDFETRNHRIPFPESGRTVIDGADDENSDFDEQNTATELITSTSSWEENWLFQKKRLRSTPNAHHPVPVPMLVPNPSEDFRALVGGVDADDLSDMSDYSDIILEDLITTEEKPLQSLNSELEEASKNSEVENEKEDIDELQNQNKEEHFSGKKEEDILNCKISNSCSKEFKESERSSVQETNKEVEQNLPSINLTNLSQKDRDSSIEDFSHQYETINKHSILEGAIQDSASTDSEECNKMICSLAEKEKEKWMNPIPLADNPYSLENINKREQQKKNEYFRIGTYTGESIDFPEGLSSNEFSKKETEKLRFSRDYYINPSKHPTSFDRDSDEYEQKFQSKDSNISLPENKFTVEKMQDEQNNETTKCIVIDKNQFSLPSVKELAKQFAAEDNKNSKPQLVDLQTRLETKHKTQILSTNEIREKEPEIDYSPVPVSKIIFNLQQAAEAPAQENHHKNLIYKHTLPATRMEIFRKIDNNFILENHKENSKMLDKIEQVRFNGKQVHSLTARSISKEFREGLKNNSYQKICPKVNRICSSGESDQGSTISNKTKTSPTPSIDLKDIKKFWEEIITANSNSTKQK